MADVPITPKIRCDNCGFTEDKTETAKGGGVYRKPLEWGSFQAASGRGMAGYPREELRFIDLCPTCAMGAHDAAAAKLAEIRREDHDAKGEA